MRVSLSGQARVVCFLILGIVVCTGLPASEPYIVARILPEWDEAGEILTLTIIPDHTLENAVFRLETPGAMVLEPMAGPLQDRFQERVAAEGFRALQAGLGVLPERSVLRLSFRPRGHQARGGVVSFILEAETADGAPVREAISVAVGYPGERPIRRHGALQFPAVALPGEPQ